MSGGELEQLVRRWDERLVAGDDGGWTWPVGELGTVLRPGASEPELEALERRLGVSLPPSYRAFLAASNGAWAQAGWGIRGLDGPPEDLEHALGFLDASRVGWFRDREPSYVDIWGYTDHGGLVEDTPPHYAFTCFVPEAEYLDHARTQDPIEAKAGHVRYALQISGDVDGYTILLNPLVVDPSGEWEAWDFGSKLPGAMRYPSFAALIEADLARKGEEERHSAAALESSRATFEDASRPLEERTPAAAMLVWHGERERALAFLVEVLGDRAAPVEARQSAASALGSVDDPRVLPAFVDAVVDAEPRLQAALVPPLAASDEPEARRAALSILTAPDVEDWVISSIWPRGAETVWQAWNLTDDPRLLVKLAYCGDTRVSEPLAQAILDSSVEPEHRESLIRYAWWPRDPSVVPALIAAAELPDTQLVPLGDALLKLGAEDDGVAVLARAVRAGEGYGQGASELGWTRRPEARAALLDVFRTDPTPALAQALGWFDDSEVAAALAEAASSPGLGLACVDALEKVGGSAGRDALAGLAAEGDLFAARALARQRDERALEPLLEALSSEDPALAFEGADGLRDLRSHAAAPALLAAVKSPVSDDVAACAAHALVSMRADEADDALASLAGSASDPLRRLAEIWR